MKAVFILFFVALLGIGGYFGYQYLLSQSPKTGTTGSQSYKSEAMTKTGTLQKAPVASSDFEHVLLSEGKSVGVTSYKVNLDDYVGKKVTITGQPSGTTLYADTVTLAK